MGKSKIARNTGIVLLVAGVTAVAAYKMGYSGFLVSKPFDNEDLSIPVDAGLKTKPMYNVSKPSSDAEPPKAYQDRDADI